jgi:hypothetical protein
MSQVRKESSVSRVHNIQCNPRDINEGRLEIRGMGGSHLGTSNMGNKDTEFISHKVTKGSHMGINKAGAW